MKNVNQRRKYGLIKWAPNGVIGQAAQVAVDRYVESLGATIRTGGCQDFVLENPQPKVDKNTTHLLKYVNRKAISGSVGDVGRRTGTSSSG